MNEIILKGMQEFMGKEIPVVYGGFGENQKCISDKTVAELHNMQTKHVREAISNNNKRFKESIDFIDLKKGVDDIDTSKLLTDIGYTKQMIIQSEHIYIFSKRGYAKLIKIFDTDLAWEVYENLLDEYFYLEQKENESKAGTSLVSCNLKIYKVEQRVENLENCMTIDYEQQNELRLLGNKVAVKILGGYESPAYKEIGKKIFYRLWKDYKIYFKVNSYRNTPRIKYSEAQEYILNWQPDTNTRITIKNLNISSQQVLEVGELA